MTEPTKEAIELAVKIYKAAINGDAITTIIPEIDDFAAQRVAEAEERTIKQCVERLECLRALKEPRR